MVEEDNSLSFGSTRFELRQRLSLPVGFSAFTMAAGIVFFWMALLPFKTQALRFLLMIPAVVNLLAPLIYPIARIDVDEHRVRFISIRLFGQWKKTVLDFQYEDVDRVECSGYPTTYRFRKEIYVVIQSLGQRIAAGNLFSIEDRRRLASHVKSKSMIHDFEFVDYVGLIGPQDEMKEQVDETKN